MRSFYILHRKNKKGDFRPPFSRVKPVRFPARSCRIGFCSVEGIFLCEDISHTVISIAGSACKGVSVILFYGGKAVAVVVGIFGKFILLLI